MSTEEKITENPVPAEPTKPKRRFKLDKKHIQGFIAGILVAAIAFTGLYYGTEGRFFKGWMDANVTFVTDATFEDEVRNSKKPVFVLIYSQRSERGKRLYEVARDKARFYSGRIKFVFADMDAPGVSFDYFSFDHPGCFLFIDGDVVSQSHNIDEAEWQLVEWLKPYA